jgi:hypothetical protein
MNESQKEYETFPEDPDVQRLTVDKLESAQRQLDTAIRLYFEDADPISIHTLTSASLQILIDINEKRGGGPFPIEFEFVEDKELRMKTIRHMRSFPNFFKHADNDPYDTKSIRPRLNESILFACEEGYSRYGTPTQTMLAFRLWFLAMNFEFASHDLLTTLPSQLSEFIQLIRREHTRATKQDFFAKILSEEVNTFDSTDSQS